MQAAIESRLHSLLRHSVQVVAAGRTDAGVHARANPCATHLDSGGERLSSACVVTGGLVHGCLGLEEQGVVDPDLVEFESRRR